MASPAVVGDAFCFTMRMTLIFSLSLLLAACTVAPDAGPAPDGPPAAPAADYETTLTRILQAVLTPGGLVDYQLLTTSYQDEFDSTLAAVEQFDPSLLTSDEAKLAFLMNAYNVRMLKNILDTPGATDIESEGLFDEFFQTPFRVAGFNMTLNQLENGILRLKDTVDGQELPAGLTAMRPSALDPRIHVGLNCAAVSCPRLRDEAFRAALVSSQLDAALADFADSPKLAITEGVSLTISSIVDWFGEDFDATGVPVGDYFLTVMNPSRPGYSTIQTVFQGNDTAAIRAVVAAEQQFSFAYNWTVNRAN